MISLRSQQKLCGLLILQGMSCAWAQSDGGAIRQQIEQGIPSPRPESSTPPLRLAPAQMPSQGDTRVLIKEFVLQGNRLLSDADLQALLSPWLNQRLSFGQMHQASQAVSEAYERAGWLARVLLPVQDVSEGRLRLQIVEANFGTAHVLAEPGSRVKPELVQRMLMQAQPSGSPLSLAALERAFLLAGDLPGAQVKGSLRAGEQEAQTDIDIQLSAQPLLLGDLQLDNYGGRSTGSTRLGANLQLQSPARLGDQLLASFSASQGSQYGRLAYTLPLGSQGWRGGVNASLMRYHLIAPEFEALDAKGPSSTLGLEASYPLLRSRNTNLYANLNLDHKFFHNQSLGADTSKYRIEVASLSFNGNRLDSWARGGSNSFRLGLSGGHVNLNGSANSQADALTTRTAGNYLKLNWQLARQQTLNESLVGVVELSGQFASKNLDSSEKFYLGGPYGVRAYPVNEGAGSAGLMARLELRASLSPQWSATGFVDAGRITINQDNHFEGAPALNKASLSGMGLSAAYNTGKGQRLQATLATPFANSAQGPRVWVSLSQAL